MKKVWITACALMVCACHRSTPAPEVVRPVRLQTVAAAPVHSESRYAGEVRPRRESALGFRVGGKMLRREVDVGQSVKAGQVLARLDPGDLSLSTQAARAQVQAQRAQFDIDRADLNRLAALQKQGYVGRADFERQKARFDASKAQLDALEAQLAVSSNQSAYSELRADHDGTISQVQAEAGQVLAAGQPVLHLAWNGEKEVAAAVPETLVGRLKVGMPVRVSLFADPGHEYPGTIRELASSADAATRTYAVRVTVPQAPETMRLGMTAVLILPLQAEVELIHLPFAAMTEREQTKGVWVFDAASSTVKFRPVQFGGVSGNEVLIAGGLTPGESVVTAGAAFLSPDQKVRPLSTPAEPAG